MWAARRRLIEPPVTNLWNVMTGGRRLGEAEAMFLQFQDQVDALRSNVPNLETAVSTSFFRFLPPAGLLPLRSGSFKGIFVDSFFSGRPHRTPEFIDGARLGALFRESLDYEPVDLSQSEMVWLYKVRQNEQAAAVQPYVIYTSAHVPYQATARVDVARWNYSNYASS
jgi:hypothetical protein